MKTNLIFYFVLVLFGTGCHKENSKNEQASLLNTKWILSYIQDTRTNAIIHYPTDAKKEISIIFSDSANDVFFKGVCNTGQGKFSILSVNDSIKITLLGTTKIACKYVEWEAYTTTNLYYAFKYKINDCNLEVYSKGSYNLYFRQ